jgi:general secretion pathway protein J
MNSNKPYCANGSASARPRGRQKGLTLIELLVAISVLAFVAVLGWRGLDSIVRARVALNEDLEHTRGMQLAFAQMQNDFAQMVTRSVVPDRTPLVIDQNRVTLIRKVYADNQPSRLQVVTYHVKDGVLMRRESEATRDLMELDNLWAAAENDANTGQDVALQSGVAALTMRLWGPNGWGEANANPEAPEQPQRIAKGAFMPRPGAPVPGTPPPPQANQSALTGLQVALQLQGREMSMLKVFLLGAV